MKRILLSILTLFLLVSNGTSQMLAPWKTLDETTYTISYPAAWELNQSGQMGTKFVFLSPLSTASDKFRENVNMMTQDLSGQNISLDKYAEISISQIKSMGTAVNFVDSKRETINGVDFQRLLYTLQQGAYQLTIEQYYFIVKETAYILTLTAETKNFAEYKGQGEKIMNSFKLK